MKKIILFTTMALLAMTACNKKQEQQQTPAIEDFTYHVDQFYDLEILRYRVPDFEQLSLQQKTLVYYLTEAALRGRDILYDQNCKHNLCIRRTLEAVYENYQGDKNSEDFKNLELYLKRVWFSNGIHHHYGEDKFLPEFSQDFFTEAVKSIDADKLPLWNGESVDDMLARIEPVMFRNDTLMKKCNQAEGQDLIATSACNYYEGVTQAEVEAYYAAHKDTSEAPISLGLNAKIIKRNGVVEEQVYKVGGLYGDALSDIADCLKKAAEYAENEQQKEVILNLVSYYESGDLHTFNDYCIAWVKDINSRVDFVNGFTETYGDPLGLTASWESIVNFKNLEATERTEKIANNAQYFEDNSPVAPEYKKKEVKGVTAKVITAAILAGDCYPSTPIGINLPNANWIRQQYGSKSVTIENITEAYDEAAKGYGTSKEFFWSEEEIERSKLYGTMTDNLHTDLHECLGHASGQLLPGVAEDALKEHAKTLEEGRADLFGLYYCADPKIVELGILPNMEAYKAQYYEYMLNGLMLQLRRIEPGKDLEEAHMRNRQMIAQWVYEHGQAENVVEFKERDGKHFIVINNYERLRELFGELLGIVQDIKSRGDYEAGKALVETYAVKVNEPLKLEIRERYAKLNVAPYKGFVNPVYKPVFDKNGNITDVTIDYTEGYVEQHLRYSHDYSVLPTYNE
ncbi:MAG: dihydrofolate reductase [Paludibacteraceae bacterium]|nr:dihydrofolate reductase [Paludibacteraceae bacterium]